MTEVSNIVVKMRNTNWTKILTPLAILYVVILVGGCIWAASLTKNNYWLIKKEANPTAAPFASVGQDDWVAILATQDFAAKSQDDRTFIANKQFEKIKGVAGEVGYDLKALQAWFQKTATDFERYPIREFKTSILGQDIVQAVYRDLHQSGFPKPSVARVFWRYFFNKGSWGVGLIALPFIIIPILVITGIGTAFLSKKLFLKWKILLGALITVILIEGWVIGYHSKHPVSLGTFLFYDAGNYVTAEGTWTSDTKLDPLQVSKLNCWQDRNQCIEATADVSGGFLSVRMSYWDVENWGQDEITFREITSAMCVNERYRIDRKNKIISYTRATKQPKPDSCAGIQDEPIVSYLTDGIKLQFKK